MKPHNGYIIHDLQKYFLLGILVLLVVGLAYFMLPFLGAMLVAAVLVTAVHPVHQYLTRCRKFPPSLSAFITLLLVTVIFVAPFTYFFFFLAGEAASAYGAVSAKVNAWAGQDITLVPSLIRESPLGQWFARVESIIPLSTAGLINAVGEVVQKVSSLLIAQTTSILKQLSVILIQIVVFFLCLFYFLRDGKKLVGYLYSLMPLSEDYRKELLKKLNHLSHAIIYGLFGAAIVQGFLVGLGFAFTGLSNAAFWGSMAALLSPLPYVGTAIIWVPAVVLLFIGNHWAAGIFLLAWGTAIVGVADNVVKPYLIGGVTALHPLAVLLVLVGGVFGFGLKGLLFGPFLLTLTLSFLHIYRLEYQSVLESKKKTS